MELEPFGYLVGDPALGPEGDPDQREIFRSDGPYRGPVALVVQGLEQLVDEDRELDIALPGSLEGRCGSSPVAANTSPGWRNTGR